MKMSGVLWFDWTEEDDAMTCGVCLETYHDPRVLPCGHHFCLTCLDTISQGHPDGWISCPVCRQVTRVKVNDLSRFHPNVSDIKVENIPVLHRFKLHPLQRPCDYCHGNLLASRCCGVCKLCFCEGCAEKHKLLEEEYNHVTNVLTRGQFCGEHADRFVSWYCDDCDVACCVLCVHVHSGHGLSDIQQTATLQRERIHHYFRSVEQEESANVENWIHETIKDVLKKKEIYANHIRDVRSHLRGLSDKLDYAERVGMKQFNVTLEDLRQKKRTWERNQIIQHVLTYVDGIPDADVVLQINRWSDVMSSRIMFTNPYIRLPQMTALTNMSEDLSNIEDTSLLQLHTLPVFAGSLTNLKVCQVFNINTQITGMTYDDVNHNLILRTIDRSAPVKVFTPQGVLMRTFGNNVTGITQGCIKDIAIDYKRHLYLLPLDDGSLVTLNSDGIVKNKVKVVKKNLSGAAYSGNDLYVTSSVTSHQVIILDPDMLTPLLTFNPKTTFTCPFRIHSMRVSSDVITHEHILVSDSYRHCVKILDTSGKVVGVCGREREAGKGGDERLFSPQGACVDPSGRAIVCDSQNNRVIAYDVTLESDVRHDDDSSESSDDINSSDDDTSDQGSRRFASTQKWEVLVDLSKLRVPECNITGTRVPELPSRACHVSCDWDGRRLFLADGMGRICVLSEERKMFN